MTDAGLHPQNKLDVLTVPVSPSPSAAFSSPSRKKRLLSETKPQRRPSTLSPQSALSSDSSPDRFRKKTRDLPNLSDCHGCGVRTNASDPRGRLQILDSFWRIVLLCKKCVKGVELCKSCPYCFKETSIDGTDCFQCCNCKRRIHKDCVSRYGSSAPWSYCSRDLGFSVCIDCWLPKSLANSIRVGTKKKKKMQNNPLCDARVTVDDDRVLGTSCNPNSMEDIVKDANSMLEKRSAMTENAKVNASRKATEAKNAVELASSTLDFVAQKDNEDAGNSGCLVTRSCTGNSVDRVIDDAELAFQLHCAINSSPRISRNWCSINSSIMAFPKVRGLNGDLSGKMPDSRGRVCASMGGGLLVYTHRKSAKKLERTVLEPFVCTRASDIGSDLGNLRSIKNTYVRRAKLKAKESCDNGEIGLAGGCAGKYDRVDGNIMESKSQSCQEDKKTESILKCDGNNDGQNTGQCSSKPDRFLLKYTKRRIGSRAISNGATEFHYNASRLENLSLASGLPMNCSEKSRTLADPLFQPCCLNMQSFSCLSGSPGEEP